MRIVAHVQIKFDYVIKNDSSLLVDGVVLDPVLFLSFQGFFHLDFLGGPSFDVDHKGGDTLNTFA